MGYHYGPWDILDRDSGEVLATGLFGDPDQFFTTTGRRAGRLVPQFEVAYNRATGEVVW